MRTWIGAAAVALMVTVAALAGSTRFRRRLRQVLCRHARHLKYDAAHGKIWDECWKCGHVGAGWTVDITDRFPLSRPLTLKKIRKRKTLPGTVESFRKGKAVW